MTALRPLTGLLLLTLLSSTSMFAQFGCTDPCACNYDPDAVFSSGFCTYDHCIEIEISSDDNVFADNSRWEIRDRYGRVQHSRLAFNTTLACTDLDCFTFHVYDEGGDGWGQFGGYTVFVDGEIVLDESFDDGSYDSMNASAPGCTEVFGCNIPLACNYSPSATFLDGSCTYEGCTDPAAENYEPEAGCESGNCVYTTTCYGAPKAPDGRHQGFTGYLSPDQWYQVFGTGNGTIYHTTNTLVLTSAAFNTDGTPTSPTSVQRDMLLQGEVTVDWEYSTFDTDSNMDYAVIGCAQGENFSASNESGQDVYQYGTFTFDCQSSITLYFAVIADLITGSSEPGILKLTNLRTPNPGCGCRIPSSCNYNPDAVTGPEDCDFSCISCNDENACNYNESLSPISAFTPALIFNSLLSQYSWNDLDEARTFFEATYDFTPCIPDVPDLGCNCLEQLTQADASTWVVQEGLGETDELNEALFCGGYQMMGCFGGALTDVIVNYPCTDKPLVFFSNAYDADIIINVQKSAPELIIIGNSINSDVTVNHAAETTVTLLDAGLNLIENIIPIGNCGCTNSEACNYDPTAFEDNGGCKYPDRCDDPEALNYNPFGQHCPKTCIYIDECGRRGNDQEGRQAGFLGALASDQWTIDTHTGDGSVVFTPFSVELTGNDAGGTNIFTGTNIAIPAAGIYSFEWYYSTEDQPGDDPAYIYTPAGGITQLSEDFGATQQQGTFQVNAEVDNSFVFYIRSNTGEGGRAHLSITHFLSPGLPPCQPGCTNPLACNYDPAAVDDNGTCFIEGCGGCTNASASNYDPAAVWDDGSCIDDNLCPTDLDNSGQTATGDLLVLLAAFGTDCP